MDTKLNSLNKLTFYIYWRYVLIAGFLALLSGFIVGLLFGFFARIYYLSIKTSLNSELITLYSGILGGVAGLIIGFYVLRWLLSKVIGRDFNGRVLELRE